MHLQRHLQSLITPFGVTNPVHCVFLRFATGSINGKLAESNNPPRTDPYSTQFEPETDSYLGPSHASWHTCPFIRIPEQEDNHHHIVGCPADEKRNDDDHGDAQRFHFGLVYESLTIRLCWQLFCSRVVGQLGALEHFFTACERERERERRSK